ncbi:hypothetical protein VCV18_010272 [Metarhizium anisopliae]
MPTPYLGIQALGIAAGIVPQKVLNPNESQSLLRWYFVGAAYESTSNTHYNPTPVFGSGITRDGVPERNPTDPFSECPDSAAPRPRQVETRNASGKVKSSFAPGFAPHVARPTATTASLRFSAPPPPSIGLTWRIETVVAILIKQRPSPIIYSQPAKGAAVPELETAENRTISSSAVAVNDPKDSSWN